MGLYFSGGEPPGRRTGDSLSTIRLGTLFEEIFTNPDNGFHKLFLPWYADPARGEAWYARTLGALGEDKTMQEYPASVEEALSVRAGHVPGGARRNAYLRRAGNCAGRQKVCGHRLRAGHAFGPLVCRGRRGQGAYLPRIRRAEQDHRRGGGPHCWRFRRARTSRPFLPRRTFGAASRRRAKPCGAVRPERGGADARLKRLCRRVRGHEGVAAPGRGRAAAALLRRAAPNLWRCLQKIQKDEQRPTYIPRSRTR